MTMDIRQLLLNAASSGRTEEIRFLVMEGGVDVNIESRSSTSPLQYASMQGRLETVRLLLGFGAKINHKNSTGWTALHYAIHQGHLDIAHLLLEKGADLFARRNDGKTPVQLLQDAQKNAGSKTSGSGAADGQHSSSGDGQKGLVMLEWHLCQALQTAKEDLEKLVNHTEHQQSDMSTLWCENKATREDLEKHMDQQRMDTVFLQEKFRCLEREMDSMKDRLAHLEQQQQDQAKEQAAKEQQQQQQAQLMRPQEQKSYKIQPQVVLVGTKSRSNFEVVNPQPQMGLTLGAETRTESNAGPRSPPLESPKSQSDLELPPTQTYPHSLEGGGTTSLSNSGAVSSEPVRHNLPQQHPRQVFRPQQQQQQQQMQPTFLRGERARSSLEGRLSRPRFIADEGCVARSRSFAEPQQAQTWSGALEQTQQSQEPSPVGLQWVKEGGKWQQTIEQNADSIGVATPQEAGVSQTTVEKLEVLGVLRQQASYETPPCSLDKDDESVNQPPLRDEQLEHPHHPAKTASLLLSKSWKFMKVPRFSLWPDDST